MGAEQVAQPWTLEDLCRWYGCTPSWVYKRTGPNASRTPRIPTMNSYELRFDPTVVIPLLRSISPTRTRSLKTAKSGKPAVHVTTERRRERLWK